MTKRHGYALLAAMIAVIAFVSAAIYAGAASDGGTDDRKTLASGRTPHNTAAPAAAGTWVGAWSASPAGAEPGTETEGLAGRSVRNVVHAGVGGTSARITLSNLYGQRPLTVTHASIAVAAGTDTDDGTGNGAAPGDDTVSGDSAPTDGGTADGATATGGTGASAVADTMRRLTFGGSTSVAIPAGRQVVSDAVRIVVPHDTDLLVTTYSPTPSGPVTYHPHARETSYVAQGDRTEDVSGAAYTEQTPYWRYLTAVDVLSRESEGTVVALGDSLTDGVSSTVGENRRWTDVLSDRLRAAAADGGPRYSVVNQGISGNRVLSSGRGRPADNPSGLDRFERDVLGRAGVRVVVIDLGVNDILRTPHVTDPDRITDGLRTLVQRAHARGLRVVGATLMPFQGHRGYRPDLEATRQAVNAQIRAGRVFDAHVDFDEALRDPYDPRRLRADYDSGDHLHPSDKGYEKMANSFDLSVLKGSAPAEL
ncbi:SGNH/GDSL hydrolase family protein [Streptomyces minutiscleroticus]|uniref:SGNH hydrolase n=1 Tax=Streptomyces minutiscleroticus TaxID=68238 RepID=A0A918KIY0_9ACTN|nr:SGNH/GDSL hydrolase family protein [Streptomyces minutiscleroticus]GGX65133.1 SGNH hydrolase [Streptomyces minutiscleroticus]